MCDQSFRKIISNFLELPVLVYTISRAANIIMCITSYQFQNGIVFETKVRAIGGAKISIIILLLTMEFAIL